MKSKTLILSILMIITSIGLVACNDKSKPNVELIQDMMDSPAIKAQNYDENSPHNIGMRVPPPHTVAVGVVPYKYKGDIAGADKNMNPLAGNPSSEVLLTGKKYYDIHCMVCHGEGGEGLSSTSVGQKMALKPPSLISDKVKGWTDGRIYHVIVEGQGVMGPYAGHIPSNYRWQVVNYIRHLQKK